MYTFPFSTIHLVFFPFHPSILFLPYMMILLNNSIPMLMTHVVNASSFFIENISSCFRSMLVYFIPDFFLLLFRILNLFFSFVFVIGISLPIINFVRIFLYFIFFSFPCFSFFIHYFLYYFSKILLQFQNFYIFYHLREKNLYLYCIYIWI